MLRKNKQRMTIVFISICLYTLIIIVLCNSGQLNNVCTTFEDYKSAQKSKNCYYDPDTLLQTPELIKKYAGKVERYNVTSKDGYILALFRIPRSNPKGIIFLYHPLMFGSRMWVGQGNDSFGFYLWRAGYDIWLTNMRGTLYSDKHISMTSKNLSFWNFSNHEVGYYDIPSLIGFIRRKSKSSKIIYIGHSLGSTVGLIYASMHSEDVKKYIRTFVFLATPVALRKSTSILKILVPFEPILHIIANTLKLGDILGLVTPFFPLTKLIFRAFPLLLVVVRTILCLGGGWTPDEIDPVFVNFDVAYNLQTSSVKILFHYLQWLKPEAEFQQYDYGGLRNIEMYNASKPPEYPVDKINIPVMFVSTYNDSLATVADVDYIIGKLSKIEVRHHKCYGLNHIDYFFGKHRKECYYTAVLEYINQQSKNN